MSTLQIHIPGRNSITVDTQETSLELEYTHTSMTVTEVNGDEVKMQNYFYTLTGTFTNHGLKVGDKIKVKLKGD